MATVLVEAEPEPCCSLPAPQPCPAPSLSHRFLDSKFYLLVVLGELVTEEHLRRAIANIERGEEPCPPAGRGHRLQQGPLRGDGPRPPARGARPRQQCPAQPHCQQVSPLQGGGGAPRCAREPSPVLIGCFLLHVSRCRRNPGPPLSARRADAAAPDIKERSWAGRCGHRAARRGRRLPHKDAQLARAPAAPTRHTGKIVAERRFAPRVLLHGGRRLCCCAAPVGLLRRSPGCPAAAAASPRAAGRRWSLCPEMPAVGVVQSALRSLWQPIADKGRSHRQGWGEEKKTFTKELALTNELRLFTAEQHREHWEGGLPFSVAKGPQAGMQLLPLSPTFSTEFFVAFPPPLFRWLENFIENRLSSGLCPLAPH